MVVWPWSEVDRDRLYKIKSKKSFSSKPYIEFESIIDKYNSATNRNP